MVDATIHYRGTKQERRRLPAVPVVGGYIFGPGDSRRLWEVAAVVVEAEAVEVFAVGVSDKLADELTAAWATWGEAAGDLDQDSKPGCGRGRGAGCCCRHATNGA